MTEAEERQLVARIARTFIGTPYHHGANVKGPDGGIDCAYLLKAVFEEAGLVSPIDVPDYSPQFMLHRGDELYRNVVSKYARQTSEPQLGDVILYKIGRVFAHGAIVVDPGYPRIVHALKEARFVIEAGARDGALAKREVQFFTRW